MSGTTLKTPLEDDFHAPAEFEPHAATLIGWPWRRDIWPFNGREAQKAFVEVIRALCKSEKVIVIAKPGTFTEDHSKELATEIASKMVEIRPTVCDDAWLRDVGPTFLVNRDKEEIRGVDWMFNGWGWGAVGYDSYKDDAKSARLICEHEGYQVYNPDLICEGGALTFDGEGTVITTESVLMDEKRNGKVKTRDEVEKLLLSYLGAEKVIWLPEGLYRDIETGGHVDNLVAFVKPGEVVLNWTDDETDPQQLISRRTEEILKKTTDAKGRRLTVHRVHQPDVMLVTEEEAAALETDVKEEILNWGVGKRLPGSYINFYIANKCVVVPQFNQPRWDEAAVKTLTGLFPGRDVIGVQARDILIGGGNIHCVTQHVPLAIK